MLLVNATFIGLKQIMKSLFLKKNYVVRHILNTILPYIKYYPVCCVTVFYSALRTKVFGHFYRLGGLFTLIIC